MIYRQIAIAALALCFVQVSSADVTDKVVFSYYMATAHPDESIREALNQASPNRQDGHIFHAYTKWDVSWHYWTNLKLNGMCQITRAQVDMSGTINLPTLVNGTEQQNAQFWTYLLALRTHEQGHVDIGKRAAHDIDVAILALPEMRSCSALGDAANAAGYQILNDYKSQEIQYDVTTLHGRTQGAVLQ